MTNDEKIKLKRAITAAYLTLLILLLMAIIVLCSMLSYDIDHPKTTVHSANVIIEDVSDVPMYQVLSMSGIELDTSIAVVEEIVIPKYTFSKEESYLLAKLAQAEAGGEDIEGKALVIRTVINRIESGLFPDNVKDVIFQNNGVTWQFSPVGSGRYYEVEPNEESYEALGMICNGWDESQGALYFRATTTESTWHSRNLEHLFDWGKQSFYK